MIWMRHGFSNILKFIWITSHTIYTPKTTKNLILFTITQKVFTLQWPTGTTVNGTSKRRNTVLPSATNRKTGSAYSVMAAIIRHEIAKSRAITEMFLITKRLNIMVISSRTYAKKIKPNLRIKPNFGLAQGAMIQSAGESLAAKGFLRPQKEYNPPDNVADRMSSICKSILGDVSRNSQIGDSEARFAVFNACYQEFQHGIPNSLLHTMETLGDIIDFYETPVNTTVPLDAMKNIDLPPNLHIEYDYNRFHPESDTMFGGVTVFNKSSTLVTGLKYKDKYKGHKAKTSWP